MAKKSVSPSSSSSSSSGPRMYSTRIDLSLKTREAMIALLNQEMANVFDLYSQTKQAHWNVKGRDFYQLHLLFDQLAGDIEDYVDMIAERVTALGGMALGTVRMAAATSKLPEFTTATGDEMQYVELLSDRFALVANSVRKAIDTAASAGDVATSDLFTEISRQLDKSLYFLESHLQA